MPVTMNYPKGWEAEHAKGGSGGIGADLGKRFLSQSGYGGPMMSANFGGFSAQQLHKMRTTGVGRLPSSDPPELGGVLPLVSVRLRKEAQNAGHGVSCAAILTDRVFGDAPKRKRTVQKVAGVPATAVQVAPGVTAYTIEPGALKHASMGEAVDEMTPDERFRSGWMPTTETIPEPAAPKYGWNTTEGCGTVYAPAGTPKPAMCKPEPERTPEPTIGNLPDGYEVAQWKRDDGKLYVSVARANRKGHVKRFAVPVEVAALVAAEMVAVASMEVA